MKNMESDVLSDEQLLEYNSTYRIKFVLAILAGLVLLAVGNFPDILGEYYPSSTLFKMAYIVFFIYAIRVFPKLKATNKEMNKRNLK